MGLQNLENSYKMIKKEKEYDIDTLLSWICAKYLTGLRDVMQSDVDPEKHVDTASNPMRQKLSTNGLNANSAWKDLVEDYTSTTKVTSMPNSFREARTRLSNASEILKSMNNEGKKTFKEWASFEKELFDELTRLEKLGKKC